MFNKCISNNHCSFIIDLNYIDPQHPNGKGHQCVSAAGGSNRADASGRLRDGPAGCADGCGRTGQTRSRTNFQNNSFIIPFISIHLLNNFLMFRSPTFSSQFSCKFHELTPDIGSPILTPLHLLVLFAATFFFHG